MRRHDGTVPFEHRLGHHDDASRGFVLTCTVSSFLLLSGFWASGAIYQINMHLDESKAAWSTTEIAGKRMKAQKSTTTYLVQLAPWEGSGGEPPELYVSKEKYGALETGAAVEVGVRRGALEIPWVADVRPARSAN